MRTQIISLMLLYFMKHLVSWDRKNQLAEVKYDGFSDLHAKNTE